MSTLYFRFAAHASDGLERSPLLERLVARASGPAPVLDWRGEAFRVIAPEAGRPPSIGAAIMRAAAAGSAAVQTAAVQSAAAQAAPPAAETPAWGCAATPVHFNVGMSSLTMPLDGILSLETEEAASLASGFNRVFGGAGVRLSANRSVLWCAFDAPIEAATHDPEAVAGHDVFGFQPTGRDAPRLRRLMSEMEMWLFDHEVNRVRTARATRPITALWLWGGGPPDLDPPAVRGWTGGRDPFFSAFGDEPQFPRAPGEGVVVCTEQPGSHGWLEVERRWLAPAADAVRSGSLHRLELSAAERCFSVRSGVNLRFWRRPRPWWESYGIQ